MLGLIGCAPVRCSDDPACIRILFLGNSYTSSNDLPGIVVKLAKSGGIRIETDVMAPGGWMLIDHINSPPTFDKIKSGQWTYVVLQEQSNIPASDSWRNSQMYPAAISFSKIIKEAGAKPILFITWAHKDGWAEEQMPTYEAMQLAVNYGYLNLGQQLHASMAPVGYAWLAYWRNNHDTSLWQDDGSHPTEKGTYLAACVFYAVITKRSPEGLKYIGNLTIEDAAMLQKIAAETVINNAKKWNLPEMP